MITAVLLGRRTIIRTNRIRELRKKNKWTQQHLSDLTGIPRSTLGEIEIHQRLLKPEQEKLLCEAFGLENTEDLYK